MVSGGVFCFVTCLNGMKNYQAETFAEFGELTPIPFWFYLVCVTLLYTYLSFKNLLFLSACNIDFSRRKYVTQLLTQMLEHLQQNIGNQPFQVLSRPKEIMTTPNQDWYWRFRMVPELPFPDFSMFFPSVLLRSPQAGPQV